MFRFGMQYNLFTSRANWPAADDVQCERRRRRTHFTINAIHLCPTATTMTIMIIIVMVVIILFICKV